MEDLCAFPSLTSKKGDLTFGRGSCQHPSLKDTVELTRFKDVVNQC